MPTRFSSAAQRGRRRGARTQPRHRATEVIPIDTRVPELPRGARSGVRGARAGRDRGEHPGPRARRRADGAVEQVRRAAADDRQQVGDRRRLLHALRRHGGRPGGDQRRAEDVRLPAGRVHQRARAAARHPPVDDHQGAERRAAARPDRPGQPSSLRRARPHHRGLRRTQPRHRRHRRSRHGSRHRCARRLPDRPQRVQAPPGGARAEDHVEGVRRGPPLPDRRRLRRDDPRARRGDTPLREVRAGTPEP